MTDLITPETRAHRIRVDYCPDPGCFPHVVLYNAQDEAFADFVVNEAIARYLINELLDFFILESTKDEDPRENGAHH